MRLYAGLTALLAAAAAWDALAPAYYLGFVPLVLLALTVLLATGSGRALAGLMGLEGLSESQRTLVGATLGLGLLAVGGLVLGAAGLYRPAAASGLLGLLLVAGFHELSPALESLAPDRALLRERPLAAAAVVLPLAAALWLCLAPPHQYDSLVYHLALPQEYARAGRLFAPPGTVYAHFPQYGEMLFTLALLLGSDVLAQMYVWLACALAVWWLFSFGRREAPMSAVLLAALLVVTHTGVLLMASTTYVEPLVMLWVTASALSFERWRGAGGRGWLALAAVFSGLALGTKYYAGIGAAILFARLVLRRRWSDAALFAGVAGALFAPWLVKNWLAVRNPVFPFLWRFFENRGVGWDNAELARGYFQVLTEYGHSRGFLRSLVSLPVLLIRNPLRFGGGMDVLGDLGWDLTLWLLPLGVWAARKNRALRGLLVFCGLWGAAWFSTGVVLRFLTAIQPLLALIGAAGWVELRERAGERWRAVLTGSAAVILAAHAALFVFVHATFGSASVPLGLETRDEFLTRRLDYYACAAWLRGRTAGNDKILLVGEQRGYYLPAAHLPSTVHMPNLFVRRANEAGSTEELISALRADGFTRVLVVPREAARLGGTLGSLTPKGAANWAGLEKSLPTEYAGRGCVVASLGRPGA